MAALRDLARGWAQYAGQLAEIAYPLPARMEAARKAVDLARQGADLSQLNSNSPRRSRSWDILSSRPRDSCKARSTQAAWRRTIVRRSAAHPDSSPVGRHAAGIQPLHARRHRQLARDHSCQIDRNHCIEQVIFKKCLIRDAPAPVAEPAGARAPKTEGGDNSRTSDYENARGRFRIAWAR